MTWMAAALPSSPAGRLVAAGAMRVPSKAIELFLLRDFLEADECAALMALVDARRRPSAIADDQGAAGFRTSETCDLDDGQPIVAAVNARIALLLDIDPALGEPLQGQRYAPGQHFRPHTDTFEPGGHDYFLHCAVSGNRTWTAMIYLNAVEDGGATRFKAIAKTIRAEPGKLVAWNNLLPDGRPNPATLHEGMKVRLGTKYVLTKWYREREGR